MNEHDLATVAHIYATTRGITMASLGTYLVRDARFFDRLAVGRVTVRRVEQAAWRLSEMWPEHLPWPAAIPQPQPPAGADGQVEEPVG